MIEFRERIHDLIGPQPSLVDDISFLEPSGNDHLMQYLYLNCPEEYRELDDWDRYNLLLADLYKFTDIEFKLDGNAHFACYVQKNEKGAKNVQAVIDLREDYLLRVYYFGNAKSCLSVNRKLANYPIFSPCVLNPNTLIELMEMLDSVTELRYCHEQLPSLFFDPVMMKGKLAGKMARQLCFDFARQFESYFYIEQICGHAEEGSQGTICFFDAGLMKVDSCRVSEFLKLAEFLKNKLNQKYEFFLKKCLIQWQMNSDKSRTTCKGNPIDINLPNPIDKIDGLIRALTKGYKKLQLYGTAERISRKLWSIKSVEWKTAEQLEFEISENNIRIFLKRKSSIPLLERMEKFIGKHINAEFSSAYF